MYSEKFVVGFSECDGQKNMTLSAITSRLQNIGQEHDRQSHTDVYSAIDYGTHVVMLYWDIVINKTPNFGDVLVDTTYNNGCKHGIVFRSYEIKDAQGVTVILASGCFAYYNVEQKCMVNPPMPLCELDEYVALDISTFALKHSKAEFINRGSVQIGYWFTDANGHMNNVSYVNLLEKFIPKSAEVKNLKIHYIKQVFEGETLYIYTHTDDNEIDVLFKDAEGEERTQIKVLMR